MRDVLNVQVSGIEGENYALDCPLETISAHCNAMKPTFLRGLLSADEVNAVRDFCMNWARTEPDANPPIHYLSPAYHRIDDDPPKSSVRHRLHKYSFFYWSEGFDALLPLFTRMVKIRNLLSNLSERYATAEPEDGYVCMPNIQHYPRGNGYMQEHTDPTVKQKVGLVLQLSAFGKDYHTGGLYYRTPDGEKLPVDPHMGPGDVFLWHPSLRHGVDPIDPDFQLDWTRGDGRWMMSPNLVTMTSLNGIKDGTAGKAVAA